MDEAFFCLQPADLGHAGRYNGCLFHHVAGARLRDEAALKGGMVSIMNHCWLDHLRSRRDFDDVDDLYDELESGVEAPDACCNRQEVIACVRAAVARLPLGQRQVLTLVELEEFGYTEVAGILDIPVGTVMSRLARAQV